MGFRVCRKVEEMLRGIGYKRRVSMMEPGSITVQVGAAAVNWAFNFKENEEITSDTFARAMKDRHKKVRQFS
jgi:hypothetical protein